MAAASAPVPIASALNGSIPPLTNLCHLAPQVVSGDDDEQPVVVKDVNEFSALLV